jgi:hypothetical protein
VSLTERLAVIVDAQTSGAVTEFRKLSAASEETDRRIAAGSKGIARSSGLSAQAIRVGLGGAAVVAGVAIAKFGLSAAHAASDMNESISKARVVFGAGADAVIAFGDTAARSLGL